MLFSSPQGRGPSQPLSGHSARGEAGRSLNPCGLAQIGIIALLLALLLSATVIPSLARAPDSQQVVGAGECAECHKQETEIWKATHHYKTFSRLPRKKLATKIAKAMGFKRIKSGSICLTCHFTSKVKNKKVKPIAGISCESCHGPAKKWLKRHGEYSGKKKHTETPTQAKKRWADAEAAGMIRPRLTYALTKNCYSCHVVPEEKLVNQGGHPAGSPFEVVSWSQGEVRHNTWHNNAKENGEASTERKRMLYALGTAAELEAALHAMAKATTKDRYAVTMAKRAEIARLRMRRLARATRLPELIQIVDAAEGVHLTLKNEKKLTAAANKVAEIARKFSAKYKGSELAAIDRYIPDAKKYRGEVKAPKRK